MTERRSGKANRWGIIMSLSMIFTTSFIGYSFIGYPLMWKYICPGLVVIIVSGFMAWKQVKREGWP